MDFLYVKLFLVHKRRKRKRLISQFLQSRDRGFNWLNMGGFHASWVFKWIFKPLLGECCVFKFAALSNCWRHGNTTWDKVLGMGKQPLVRHRLCYVTIFFCSLFKVCIDNQKQLTNGCKQEVYLITKKFFPLGKLNSKVT